MKSQAAIILVCYALFSLSPISGLNIENWDISAYLKGNGNHATVVHKDVIVTWTGTPDETYLFASKGDYNSCDFTDATHLDNEEYKQGAVRAKGAKFFGRKSCPGDVCDNCSKIRIAFRGGPKKFTKATKTEYSAVVLVPGQEIRFRECRKQCMQDPACMGFQFKREQGKFECTTYSTVPAPGTTWTKGPGGCYTKTV